MQVGRRISDEVAVVSVGRNDGKSLSTGASDRSDKSLDKETGDCSGESSYLKGVDFGVDDAGKSTMVVVAGFRLAESAMVFA